MNAPRFDALARLVGARISRRVAVGLAATGLVTTAGADAQAVRCTKQNPCPECQRCKKHKCKPKKVLSQCTEGGFCCTADLCCPKGQTCDGVTCQTCPDNPDFCSHPFPICGYYGPGKNDWCGCITSDQDVTTCSSLFFGCFACTTDQQCTDEFEVEAICADISGCGQCGTTGGKACLIKDCVDVNTAAAARSEAAGSLQRLSGVRPAR
jgi:hypothetical protein